MLRVKIDIVPFGDEARAYEIHRFDIFRKDHDVAGPGEAGKHAYGVIEIESGTNVEAGMLDGQITHRRTLGAVELVRMVLNHRAEARRESGRERYCPDAEECRTCNFDCEWGRPERFVFGTLKGTLSRDDAETLLEAAGAMPSDPTGIGIASYEEMKARTMAVAMGEIAAGEPKIWFTSIEAAEDFIRKAQADLAELRASEPKDGPSS
jgi:hypothetical protein